MGCCNPKPPPLQIEPVDELEFTRSTVQGRAFRSAYAAAFTALKDNSNSESGMPCCVGVGLAAYESARKAVKEQYEITANSATNMAIRDYVNAYGALGKGDKKKLNLHGSVPALRVS